MAPTLDPGYISVLKTKGHGEAVSATARLFCLIICTWTAVLPEALSVLWMELKKQTVFTWASVLALINS